MYNSAAPDSSEYAKIERKAVIRKRIVRTLTYILLTVWGLVVLFPFYWMILTSLKGYGEYNSEYIPKFFTLTPTLENYTEAFNSVPLGRYLLNTLIFTVATTAIMMVVITLAAYAFDRLEFRGKNVVFTLFLSLMMIPNELVVITNFVTITDMNLRNTFLGLILPSVTSVFYIYLLKENFAQVPNTLYYAAKVDGTSDLKFLLRVMVPICKPTLITIGILKVIECWKLLRLAQIDNRRSQLLPCLKRNTGNTRKRLRTRKHTRHDGCGSGDKRAAHTSVPDFQK